MKEIQSILFGKFNEEATFRLGTNIERNILRSKIYEYFKSQNNNQLQWSDDKFNDQYECNLPIWIKSRRFDLKFEKKLGDLILKKNIHYDYWGIYHLLSILFIAFNFDFFDNIKIIASSIYLLIFLIIYIPIRKKEKKIWYQAIGIIEGLTGLSVKE